MIYIVFCKLQLIFDTLLKCAREICLFFSQLRSLPFAFIEHRRKEALKVIILWWQIFFLIHLFFFCINFIMLYTKCRERARGKKRWNIYVGICACVATCERCENCFLMKRIHQFGILLNFPPPSIFLIILHGANKI